MEPLPGRTVLVVGMGRSGISACAFLRQRGCRVRVTDQARTPDLSALVHRLAAEGISAELGGHTEPFCEGSDLVVVSPGVPSTALPIQWALRHRVPVIGELELGARFCRGRIVAISGSNGKSTVSAWVGTMLEMAERPCVVAGNMGTPFSGQLARIGAHTTVILEVSSFQLEWVEHFQPSVACLLNVTPNHLDRHHSLPDYVAAKRRLLTQQRASDWAVLNADDPACQALRPSVRGRLLEFSCQRPVRGAYLAGQALCLMLRDRCDRVATVGDPLVPGRHNVANALAVVAIGGLLGLDLETMAEAIRRFRGLPHRLEPVASWHGIHFVNDSKSTTVEAGVCALQTCPGRAVLIAGGQDKGSDFSRLREVAGHKLRAAVLVGIDGPRIVRVLEPLVPTAQARTMPEAVHMAARLAQSGDWVLLSPMCASFDMFRDFEERGDAFKHSVRALVSLERQPHARATHPPDGYPATGWVPRHRRGTRPHRAGRAPAAPR